MIIAGYGLFILLNFITVLFVSIHPAKQRIEFSLPDFILLTDADRLLSVVSFPFLMLDKLTLKLVFGLIEDSSGVRAF